MAQLQKALHVRKGGNVENVALYNSTADTTGNVLKIKVDGATAYAQLVPPTGYAASKLRVRRDGATYAVATRGFTMVQGFVGAFAWGMSTGHPGSTWLVERETIYVPHEQNVRLILAMTWGAGHSGYYGSIVRYYIDGSQIYSSGDLTGGGTTTFYDGYRTLGPGPHTLDLYVSIAASIGDSSHFSCGWLQNQGILTQY